jgi:hypothetical protein
MKRFTIFAALLIAALAFAAVGIADPGNGKGKGGGKSKRSSNNKFAYTVTTTDNGSCGNPWATDVVKRTFKIKKRGANTYQIQRKDKGTFTTLGGVSPGKCDVKTKHGSTVRAGVVGKFNGYLTGTVTGTFNPSATCTASCGSTDVFIATFFGAAAVDTFTCFQGYAGCKFNFNYDSNARDLRYRHWQDRGTNGRTEVFVGDIANS